MPVSDKVVFAKKELAGSRLRCLMLTSGSDALVAGRLRELARPHDCVLPTKRRWMPGGFLEPDEALIGQSERFLDSTQRNHLVVWWLGRLVRRNLPNWDLVAEAVIDKKPGLILVEAKAHGSELHMKSDGTGAGAASAKEIGRATGEATDALNGVLQGWALSHRTHYQLSNRFAWSWKLASMGIPVILVYLGFLNADEMIDQGDPLRSVKHWREVVLDYAKGIVPAGAWDEKPIQTSGVPFRALIRAMDIDFRVERAKRD
jgi:hypothetical protein